MQKTMSTMDECEVCEQLEGSAPVHTIYRSDVFYDFANIPEEYDDGLLAGWGNVRKEGCYRFSCTCGGYSVISEGWTPEEFDSNNDCMCLLIILIIYETERLNNLNQNFINNLDQEFLDSLGERLLKHLGRELTDSHSGSEVYKEITKKFTWEQLEGEFIKNGQYSRYGLEYVEIYDNYMIPIYDVIYRNKEWSCTCKGFYYHKHCKHIKTVKAKEQAMQNRRDLGISLATLFNSNK